MFRFLILLAVLINVACNEAEVMGDGSSVTVDSDCIDENENCGFWASTGECDKNPRWMLEHCKVSCDSCDYESYERARERALGEVGTAEQDCDENDSFCRAAKIASSVPKGSNERGAPRVVDKLTCSDRHKQCRGWQRSGECEVNPGWMIVNCPQSCNACHLLDPKVRCSRAHLNLSDVPVYAPGDMGRMFSTIHERFNDRYGVTVHSQSPWVVTFDNFVTDEEADALIAQQKKFERSTDTGSMNEYGETGRVLSTGRTSSNSWCNRECEKHPHVDQLLKKIEEVVGIPRINYESFQVLRYDLGQKYNTHHDYGSEDKSKVCGPRILTFFLYLSDVEEGGETAFPDLGIAVKPKKGQALLWPSTKDDQPAEVDHRTRHEARPVIKGRKFAANSWIHLHDFMTPNLWGCTGTFDEL